MKSGLHSTTCCLLSAAVLIAAANNSLAQTKPAVKHSSAAEWTSIVWAGLVGDSQVAYVTQQPGRSRQLHITHGDSIVLSEAIEGKPLRLKRSRTICWTACAQGSEQRIVRMWNGREARGLMRGRIDSIHGDSVIAKESGPHDSWNICSVSSQESVSVSGVVGQHWASNGTGLLSVETKENGVQLVAYSQGRLTRLSDSSNGELLTSKLSHDGGVAAALFRVDDTGEVVRFDLGTGEATRWSFPDSELFPAEAWQLSLFGTAHRLALIRGDVVTPAELTSVPQVLSWNAPELSSRFDPERELTVLSDRVGKVALEARAEPILSSANDAFVLILSDRKYVPENEWDWPPKLDVVLYELATGKKTQLTTGIRSIPQWSKTGRYLCWWNRDERAWHAFDTALMQHTALTEGAGAKFEERHAIPARPGAIAALIWSQDDDCVLVPEESGLWRIELPSANKYRIGTPLPPSERINWMSLRSVEVQRKLFLVSENRMTQASTVWQLDCERRETRRVIELDERVVLLDLAEDGSELLLSRERFDVFPDLWTLKPDTGALTRVTELNQQQKAYRWGSPHVVTWKSDHGTELHGTLLLPEGVTKDATIPLVVYVYENEFRNHHVYDYPRPRSSNINPAVYVSNGYAVFLPNVHLDVGKPTVSAAKSVLGGIDAVLETGYINSDRIGIQAHSFGAFLTASLITQTDRFSAAVLSAPVTDLVSAYLAKRDNTSRISQYEQGQSRLGASLWERPELYLTQSPVLRADRIRTPVLIMANPNDDAVPHTQGLELFLALRRLSRPAWLVSYPNAGHGLHDPHQREDWAERMFHFFECTLNNRLAPQWMRKETGN